jgi:aquaporin TIP
MLIRHAVAEFIGVFALMFVGGGAIIESQGQPWALVAIAMAHALVLAGAVCATLHSSGGQFNPAVSIALAVIGLQPWIRAVVFVLAQVLGAVVGAWLLDTTLGAYRNVDAVSLGATIGSLTQAGARGSVLILEAVATFLLMFVILGSAADPKSATRPAAGFAIGMTVGALILFIGPLTGASMNPARSFGPALMAGQWLMHGVYWAGPILGATAAAVVYRVALGLGKQP